MNKIYTHVTIDLYNDGDVFSEIDEPEQIKITGLNIKLSKSEADDFADDLHEVFSSLMEVDDDDDVRVTVA